MEQEGKTGRQGQSNALVALGVVLLVAVAILVATASNPLEARLVQAAFPAAVAVAMVAYGRWEHDMLAGNSSTPLYQWMFATEVYFLLIGGWFFVLSETYETSVWLAIATSVAGGLALGSVIGVYALQLQASTRELERANADLERANAELNAFASIVSHDLRNPIQVASGSLELLAETSDDDTNVERIEHSLDRIDEIIENVLVLTRSIDHVDDQGTVDVGDAATRAWQTVDTDDMELVLEHPPVLSANDGLLITLLENLFRNSVEHATATAGGDLAATATGDAPSASDESDPITVTVDALDDEDGFYVADDGPGIPGSVRESAFELGESGDGGTGLGLYAVGRVAEAHDWSYRVADGGADGARFEFRTAS